MITIMQRLVELRSDATLGEKGLKTLSSLAFKPVTDTMTGEEFALTLAIIIAYGEQTQHKTSPPVVGIDDTPQGKVYNASIDDSVAIAERFGG